MSNARIVSFSDPALRDKLTNLVRDAARPRLQTALNAEFEIETPGFAKPPGIQPVRLLPADGYRCSPDKSNGR